MDTSTTNPLAVERAYRTLAASISDCNFYRFISSIIQASSTISRIWAASQ